MSLRNSFTVLCCKSYLSTVRKLLNESIESDALLSNFIRKLGYKKFDFHEPGKGCEEGVDEREIIAWTTELETGVGQNNDSGWEDVGDYVPINMLQWTKHSLFKEEQYIINHI